MGYWNEVYGEPQPGLTIEEEAAVFSGGELSKSAFLAVVELVSCDETHLTPNDFMAAAAVLEQRCEREGCGSGCRRCLRAKAFEKLAAGGVVVTGSW